MDQIQHRGPTHVKYRRTKCSHHGEEAPGICVSSEKKVNVYLPSLMMKVPNHLYVLGDTCTCHT
jgi:hypothetical protein